LSCESSGKTGIGRHGIWRASIPAMAGSVCDRLLRRQSRPRLTQLRSRRFAPPALFLSLLMSIVLFSHTTALPICLGFYLLPGNAAAITKGCKKGTCCTPLCYLDKNGIHHCVHIPNGDSCECSQLANNPDVDPIPLSNIGILPDPDNLLPTLLPTGWVFQLHKCIVTHIPAVPFPPPK
jgi:hypothetical protein